MLSWNWWFSAESDSLDSEDFPLCKILLFSPSHVRLFANPWTTSHHASLSFTTFRSVLKLMSIESVMSSKHLILCFPLLLLPSICPSIRVFSNESALHIRWPKYWSFSFSISSSSEYSGYTYTHTHTHTHTHTYSQSNESKMKGRKRWSVEFYLFKAWISHGDPPTCRKTLLSELLYHCHFVPLVRRTRWRHRPWIMIKFHREQTNVNSYRERQVDTHHSPTLKKE